MEMGLGWPKEKLWVGSEDSRLGPINGEQEMTHTHVAEAQGNLIEGLQLLTWLEHYRQNAGAQYSRHRLGIKNIVQTGNLASSQSPQIHQFPSPSATGSFSAPSLMSAFRGCAPFWPDGWSHVPLIGTTSGDGNTDRTPPWVPKLGSGPMSASLSAWLLHVEAGGRSQQPAPLGRRLRLLRRVSQGALDVDERLQRAQWMATELRHSKASPGCDLGRTPRSPHFRGNPRQVALSQGRGTSIASAMPIGGLLEVHAAAPKLQRVPRIEVRQSRTGRAGPCILD